MKASNRTVPGKAINELQFVGNRIEELEAALARSLNNQKALQESLQDMIDTQQHLSEKFEKERVLMQNRIDQLTRQLQRKSTEFQAANRQLADFTDLLEESKQAMQSREEQLSSKDSTIRRLNELLRQQKKHIEQLESDKLYNSITECRVCQDREPSRPDSLQLYEVQEKYEKQIVELEYQLRRLEQALQNESDQGQHLQKQNMDFKRWLNRMVGVDRVVVPGCEKVIMRELEKRLAATS